MFFVFEIRNSKIYSQIYKHLNNCVLEKNVMSVKEVAKLKKLFAKCPKTIVHKNVIPKINSLTVL